MKSVSPLFVLLPSLLALTACGSVLADARDSFKGGWVSSSYDMAKAEAWAPGEQKKSKEGVKPDMRKDCYVPGTVAESGTAERCYLFYGDKLFSRTASYFRSGAEALSLFYDLASAAKAKTIVFGHGPKTRKALICATVTDGKSDRTPYAKGSTVFADTSTADAVKARDGGTLCGYGDIDDFHWVRLEPHKGKYRVSYTETTRDGAAHTAYEAHGKALKALFDAKMKKLDEGISQ